MAKAKTTWTESGLIIKERQKQGAARGATRGAERGTVSGRKGGYLSERNLDLNKSQSIEDLTGGRIRKKG